MQTEPRACLIATCESWWSTATLPALLAQHFVVTGLSPGALSLSRYVARKLSCSRDPQSAALAVRELVANQRFDWIVVADDALFRALVDHGSRAALRGWFPVDPERDDLLALVTSKHVFAQRAPDFGVPVPASRLAATVEGCLEQGAALGYPIVAKGPYGFSGSEVSLAADENALRGACAKLFERHENVLLQRFVDGPSASVAVLYQHGSPLAYKAYFTECPYPNAYSAATVHLALRHPSLEPIVRAVGTATGFHGMAGIDFVVDATSGRLFAIEINPRPISAFSGLRSDRAFFGPALARFLRGETAPPVRNEPGDAAQAYFPDYGFYFLDRADKRKADSYRRLWSALKEARGAEAAVAGWAIARYAYDRLGKLAPGLRAWIDARRREA